MTSSRPSPFEIQVEPAKSESYQLALWQQVGAQNGTPPQRRRLAILRGTPLLVAMDDVLTTLKSDGYRPTALQPAKGQVLPVSDETGVRLGLLFLALRPLSKVERMDAIASGLRAMPAEELYYWFSKCVSADRRRDAQRALRVLLGGK